MRAGVLASGARQLGSVLLVVGALAGAPNAQVLGDQKVSSATGGFAGALGSNDEFGSALAVLADFDGNGVPEVAVGVPSTDAGGTDRGSVFILFLESDGTVLGHQQIGANQGGFTGVLDNNDRFGSSVVSLGDLDGDGIVELAVGAPGEDDGGTDRGAVWILFMNADGTVKAQGKISQMQGSFGGALENGDAFGHSLAAMDDLDGDRMIDLAVGARLDDDGGSSRGAVWILFLNADGTVKGEQKISDVAGGFTGQLDSSDFFGSSLAYLGDLDGDGVGDLAVGAYSDDDGGINRGAVWVLNLRDDGTVRSHTKISHTSGGLQGELGNGDSFGQALSFLGDVDGDGILELAVGAPLDDEVGSNAGSIWLLSIGNTGSVVYTRKITTARGGFATVLDPGDEFGVALASLGDLDGDGVADLIAGAGGDDDGGDNEGALWTLFLGQFASVAYRGGSNINIPCLGPVNLPVIGADHVMQVVTFHDAGALFSIIFGYTAPSEGIVASLGELLVDFSSEFVFGSVVSSQGFSDYHMLQIPDETALLGLEIYCQAGILGGVARLCNGMQLVVGY